MHRSAKPQSTSLARREPQAIATAIIKIGVRMAKPPKQLGDLWAPPHS